ncbi:MAG: hypothetical protein HOP19_06580 [Acidobacteria bacterium]|nr:hypothetical protein [Acidobacteriota bacterium]
MAKSKSEELIVNKEKFAAPPSSDAALKRRQELVDKLNARDNQLGIEFRVNPQGFIFRVSAQVNDPVRMQIQKEHPELTQGRQGISDRDWAEFPDPLLKSIKRFDWRTLGVIPFVRHQGKGKGTCWAHAATAAFESSLMILRLKTDMAAKARTPKVNAEADLLSFMTATALVPNKREVREKVGLNVKRTVVGVKKSLRNNTADWYERAFIYFMETGFSLADFKIFPETDEAAFLEIDKPVKKKESEAEIKGQERIKAIYWNYIQPSPRNISVPQVAEMKRALLIHGPLVVGFTYLNNDDTFPKWNKLRRAKPAAKDQSLISSDDARVFPLQTPTEEEPTHAVLIIGWDDSKGSDGAWIVQNSFGTNWGYQCQIPQNTENRSLHVNDRGFAYIEYGSNDLGRFATFIEADLLTLKQEKTMRSFSASLEVVQNAAAEIVEVTQQATESVVNLAQTTAGGIATKVEGTVETIAANAGEKVEVVTAKAVGKVEVATVTVEEKIKDAAAGVKEQAEEFTGDVVGTGKNVAKSLFMVGKRVFKA